MTLFELWFSQGICPVVGLLGRMVVLFLFFKEPPHMEILNATVKKNIGATFPRAQEAEINLFSMSTQVYFILLKIFLLQGPSTCFPEF